MRTLVLVASLLVSAHRALAVPAQDDDAHVLVAEGDVLANGDTVLGVQPYYDVLDDGRWTAIVTTDRPGVTTASAFSLLRSGVPVLTSGDVLSNGYTVALIRDADIESNGSLLARVEALPPGSQDMQQFVWLEGLLLLGTGPIVVPGIPAGSSIDQVTFAVRGEGAILAGVTFDVSPQTTSLLRLDLTAPGNPPTLVAHVGTPVGPVGGTLGGAIYGNIASDGTELVVASFLLPPGTTAAGYAVTVAGTPVLHHGAPGPLPGTVWSTAGGFTSSTCAPGGRWVSACQVEDTTTGVRRGALVRGSTLLALEGDPVPDAGGAVVAPFSYLGLALGDDAETWATLPVANPSGTVLWKDGDVVLRSGVSTARGAVIEELSTTFRDVACSRDGRRCLVRGDLAGDVEALFSVERGIGSRVLCLTAPNSTGTRGKLRMDGSSYVAFDDLTVTAFDLPPNAFGYLTVSSTLGFFANPGGSVGNLCLGGAIGRYVAQVQSSGASRAITTVLALQAVPQPTGNALTSPGDSWHFQLWHRDVGPTGPVSNWTEARSVTLR